MLLLCVLSSSAQVEYTITDFGGLTYSYEYDGLTYTNANGVWDYDTNNNGVAIMGYTGTNVSPMVPETINALPVTSIGDAAFESDTNLVGIILLDTVTNIGDDAFSSSGLMNITIPNSVVYIGAEAFLACQSLTNISIGTNVNVIGKFAFEYCTSLSNLVLPENTTDIGVEAFEDCMDLTNVVFPDSMTNIEDDAFNYCAIATVNIPKNISNIGVGAFGGDFSLMAFSVDSQNQFYSSAAGVLFDKGQKTLIAYPDGLMGSYTIPDTVTNIGSMASRFRQYRRRNHPKFWLCVSRVTHLLTPI